MCKIDASAPNLAATTVANFVFMSPVRELELMAVVIEAAPSASIAIDEICDESEFDMDCMVSAPTLTDRIARCDARYESKLWICCTMEAAEADIDATRVANKGSRCTNAKQISQPLEENAADAATK